MLGELLLVACMAVQSSDAVRLETWLLDHGLGDVAIETLENQLRVAPASDRAELRRRLAMVSASRLATIEDPVHRRALLYRAEELLDELRGPEALPLQLEILAIGAAGLEGVVDRHRLGLLDDDAVDGEAQTALRLRQRLRRMHDEMVDTVEDLERRPTDTGRVALRNRRRELATLRARQRRAAYLLGWVTLHAHELGARPARLDDAQRLFESVIELPVGAQGPDDAPGDLRSELPVGWSMIGQAVTLARQGRTEQGLAWLDALDDQRVSRSVRDAVGRWRLQVLLDGGRLDDAAGLIEAGDLDMINAERLTLAARTGYEAGHVGLAEHAVAELGRRGEITHLRQLARQWPMEGGGFAPRVALALAAWDEAGTSGDREAWARAARRAQQALAVTPEAETDLKRSMHRLAAWSHWQCQEWTSAVGHFRVVATLDDADMAEEALVMAVAGQQRLIERGEGDEDLLADLLGESLERFPDGRWSGGHAVELAELVGDVDAVLFDRLMRVGPEDDAWPRASGLLEQVLYERWTGAPGALDRDAAVDAYLAYVLPIIPVARDSTWADRMLAVALDSGRPRIEAAQLALARLDELTLGPESPEHRARQTQVAVLTGDLDRAIITADAAWACDAQDPWSRIAVLSALEALAGDPMDDASRLEDVRRLSQRLLSRWPDDRSAAGTPEGASVLRGLADAAWNRERRTGDRQDVIEAASMLDRLTRAGMSEPELLRRRALLADVLGQHATAMRMWTELGSKKAIGTEDWFRARLGRLAAQAHLQPGRALDALNQLETLYPDYGPPPWNIDLRALHAQLQSEGTGP